LRTIGVEAGMSPARSGISLAVLGAPDIPSSGGGVLASCAVAELGTCVQLTASGELDLAAVPMLHEVADRVTYAAGRLVVLDLCDASFVDGAVLHFALALQHRAEAHGGALVVVAPARTKGLFALVGADGVTVVEDAARDVATTAAS
jgi:anti-anti-sigma factor